MAYMITMKEGNLLNEESATFIVNSSNTRLLLGSGVSMAFKRHCGLKLQEEMTQKYKSLDIFLQKGDVVATSAANATNFEYALHVATMDYNPGLRGAEKDPTLESVKLSLYNIESYIKWYAENKSRTKRCKLVLPMMGCGVGKLNKVDVLNIYEDFFKREVDFQCEVVIYDRNF